jgi:hypothetical protein
MCDICVKNSVYQTNYKDCRAYVLALEEILFCAQLRSYKPGFKSFVDFLQYDKKKKSKKNKKLLSMFNHTPEPKPMFKKMSRVNVEKLIREMIFSGLIEEEFITNQRAGIVVLKGNRKFFNIFKSALNEASIFITDRNHQEEEITIDIKKLESANRRKFAKNISINNDIENNFNMKKKSVKSHKKKVKKEAPIDYEKKELNMRDRQKIRANIFKANRNLYKTVRHVVSDEILYSIKNKKLRTFQDLIFLIEKMEGIAGENHFIFLKEILKLQGNWIEEKESFIIKAIEYGYDLGDDFDFEELNNSIFNKSQNGKRKQFGLEMDHISKEIQGVFMSAKNMIYDKKGYAMETSSDHINQLKAFRDKDSSESDEKPKKKVQI